MTVLHESLQAVVAGMRSLVAAEGSHAVTKRAVALWADRIEAALVHAT